MSVHIEKSGVYRIRCAVTGEFYIGSSTRISRRWSEHRGLLRKGKSPCLYLQEAWACYGEQNFTFTVIELCPRDLLVEREQYFLDTLQPSLNIVRDASRHVSDDHIQKLVAFNRARYAKLTHCPHGHPYDEANTYRDKRGKRCRACNALRVAAIIAKQPESEKQKRLARNMSNYYKNYETRRKQGDKYAAEHKAEKREYDRRRREMRK